MDCRLWHYGDMTKKRIVLIVTCLLVAALGAWLAIVRGKNGEEIATAVSALGAVAAVGVAIWAALRGSQGETSMRVSRTGKATTETGNANSGISIKADTVGSGKAERTGDAKSGKGHANTGIQQE